ncbi:MAG: hypothetical protein M1837_004777 [Sclerophora amabilis]|nr:MAG: hypothetical protein M1837_004777 [Sclerophora amabilis]
MARVRANATRLAQSRRRAGSKPAANGARPHKVIFESVTQEKQKLRTVFSFQAQAPPGYTFIPAGNPRLTQRCKEYSRAKGNKIFIVSTSHKKANNITQHVHRIGYHFFSPVVNQACQELNLYISRTGRVREQQYIDLPAHLDASQESRSFNRDGTPGSVSQERLNSDARDALTDLFPKIPERDKKKIISRAFKKGKNKVGTAEGVSLPRRVQLAVVAHIRHLYTNYDRLVKIGTFQDARAQIKQACYDKLLEWRGDDEDGKVATEEILREVIVISDDEDADDDDDQEDDESSEEDSLDRDSSVELISSHPIMQELQYSSMEDGHEQGMVDDMIDNDRPYIQDESLEGGRRYAAKPLRYDPERQRQRVNRRGFHRYEAVGEDHGQVPKRGVQPYKIADERQFVPPKEGVTRPTDKNYSNYPVTDFNEAHDFDTSKLAGPQRRNLTDQNVPFGLDPVSFASVEFRGNFAANSGFSKDALAVKRSSNNEQEKIPHWQPLGEKAPPPLTTLQPPRNAQRTDQTLYEPVQMPREDHRNIRAAPSKYHPPHSKRLSYPPFETKQPQDVALPSVEASVHLTGRTADFYGEQGRSHASARLTKDVPYFLPDQFSDITRITNRQGEETRIPEYMENIPEMKRRRLVPAPLDRHAVSKQIGPVWSKGKPDVAHLLPASIAQEPHRSDTDSYVFSSPLMSSKHAPSSMMPPVYKSRDLEHFDAPRNQGTQQSSATGRALPRPIIANSHESSLPRESYISRSELSRNLENHRAPADDTRFPFPYVSSRSFASRNHYHYRPGDTTEYGTRQKLLRSPYGDGGSQAAAIPHARNVEVQESGLGNSLSTISSGPRTSKPLFDRIQTSGSPLVHRYHDVHQPHPSDSRKTLFPEPDRYWEYQGSSQAVQVQNAPHAFREPQRMYAEPNRHPTTNTSQSHREIGHPATQLPVFPQQASRRAHDYVDRHEEQVGHGQWRPGEQRQTIVLD